MSSPARAADRATRFQHDRKRHSRRRSRGVTTLMYAAQQGDVDRVRRILRSQSSSLFERDRTGKSALHYCCTSDSVCSAHAADVLVMAAPDLVESRDEDGFTPLHLAVIAGNMQLVTFLLANGADVTAVDHEKHTVVHWATVCGETAALRAVLAAGAPVSTPDVHGGYPLHYAAQMCGGISNDKDSSLGMQVLQALLMHRDVNVSVTDSDKRQPLLWAASAGSAKAMLALVRAGAAVEAADKDGLTALHCAASRGHTDCLDTLLTLCGASPDVIDSNGCTALHYAVTLGHADATALLLAHGADPNRQDRKGRSPAHCGCAKGQLETVKLIGAHRAKLWLRNARGDLPLHEAAASGRRELVQWLLGMRPSQVNARNNDGRCPLHMAALNDNSDMCKILLDAGAQVNPVLRTSRNVFMTPLDCALQRGFRSTAKFLQLHGGVPANRLAELRNQPGSVLNLHIRDDVTLWGDSSSEIDKEQGDAVRSSRKAYKKKIAHKSERTQDSGSDVEIEKTEKKNIESVGKTKRRSSDKTRERKSSATPTPPTSAVKRSSSKKTSSRMEYTNEIIINGKTEINIHQTREIILDKESVLVNKATETVVPSETAVRHSASSAKERRPRSAKFSKGRDRSGRTSAEKEATKARSSITSPKTIIQQEKESRQPPLNAQNTNTSEETTETVIENKVMKTVTSRAEDEFLKDTDSKKGPDQQSFMSNTSEDIEEHKEFVVEASVHEPPRSHLENEPTELGITEKNAKGSSTDIKKEEEPPAEEKDQTVVSEKDDQQKEPTIDNEETKSTVTDVEKGTEDQKTDDAEAATVKSDISEDKNILQEAATKEQDAIKETETENILSDIKNDLDKTDIKNSKNIETKETDAMDISDLLKSNDTEAMKIGEETSAHEPVQEKKSLGETQEASQTASEATKVVDTLQENTETLNEGNLTEIQDEMGNKVELSLESSGDQTQAKDDSAIENSNLAESQEIKIGDTDKEDEKASEDQIIQEQDTNDNTEVVTKPGDQNKTADVDEPQTDSHNKEPPESVDSKAAELVISSEKLEKHHEGNTPKKRGKKQKESHKKQTETQGKQKDQETKKKKALKTENPGKNAMNKNEGFSDEDYISPAEEESLTTPTAKTHKSFRVLDEGHLQKPGKTANSKGKKSGKKETRSRSEENKKDRSKERDKFKHSKIPTPLGKPMLSKSDRHLDKSHLMEKRALQGVLDARVPSLPNIHQGKDRLKEPPRSESNMSAPLLASPHSDDESLSDVEHEPRSLVARNRRRVKKRPKTRDARSAGSDYESSNLIDSGFEPSPRSTRIPKWRNMSDRGVNMTSVTQNIQSNIRKYHLERKIFQHLLELKRHQIRAGQHNEAVLVKRAIDAYHQSCASTVGAGRYIPEDFTFKSFEKFLYESLRKLQKNDVQHMKGLPETPSNPLLCTRSTNRCMHAVHAYTGVPCAAYLPRMDHHTIPKIGFNSVNCKPGTGFLPHINSKKAVTLELSHGTDKQVISLPTDRLDQNKRYYVTFTVKGQEPSSSNGEDGDQGHVHSKSD